jgi:hypothetical protein
MTRFRAESQTAYIAFRQVPESRPLLRGYSPKVRMLTLKLIDVDILSKQKVSCHNQLLSLA